MNPRRVIAVLVVSVIGLPAVVACSSDAVTMPGVKAAEESAIAEYRYVIPNGTARQIAQGDPVDIMPADLEVTVGETIEIVNDDVVGHSIGVFYVGAGETLRQTFTQAGSLAGECTVNPSGQFSLTVNA